MQSVSKTLNTNTNWPVFHVRRLSLWHWVVVNINHLVEVLGDALDYLMQLFIVVRFIFEVSKARQRNGRKVANSYFIFACVLHNLSAEV